MKEIYQLQLMGVRPSKMHFVTEWIPTFAQVKERWGNAEPCFSPGTTAGSICRLERGGPTVTSKSPWLFLKSVWSPEPGNFLPTWANSLTAPTPSILEFLCCFFPNLFSICSCGRLWLWPQSERRGWGEKEREKERGWRGLREWWKGQERENSGSGWGLLQNRCVLCWVGSEASAELWLTFSVAHNESKARVWVDKEMCGGLSWAHSGYSPRRAIMGNRHIPVHWLPTPYLFSRKEKQEKNVRVLDGHGWGGSSNPDPGGFPCSSVPGKRGQR